MSLYYKIVVFAGAAIGLGWAIAEGYGIGGIGAFIGFLEEDEDPDQEDKLEK